MTYADLLAGKTLRHTASGIDVPADAIHPLLFPFQRDLTRWALRKGRAAIFADTGLGKTFMQLEWARLIGGRCLIVAPLSVARQTVREAHKIELLVTYTRGEPWEGIGITNYEMAEHFDPADLASLVLDESSILKALAGKTRRLLTSRFAGVPYRLACTATPAPNDIAEIGNHSEFLGVMRHVEMLSAFFVTDEEPGGKQAFRLKGHAREAFYSWLTSWAMALTKPSDLGYEDDGYILPALSVAPEYVESDYVPDGQLFFAGLKGITDRTIVRRGTVEERVERAAAIVNDAKGQVICWHGLNDEGYALLGLIPDAVLVEGSQSPEDKAAGIESFQDGKVRVLISKPRIAGFGLNLQNAHRQVFVGLSDSWEAYYQCIRRSWRFGQTQPVDVRIVLSEPESAIYENVMRKEREALTMREELIAAAVLDERKELEGIVDAEEYAEETVTRAHWTMMLGDSTDRLAEIADGSIDMTIFSPPFLSLFVYSPSPRDLGNSTSDAQFYEQFGYIIRHLLRVTKPGRLGVVHCQQVTYTMTHDGQFGQRDFRGDLIRAFRGEGWAFQGEVAIDKDPQAQAIRTKSRSLLFVQKERDRSWLRPALCDYLLIFRAPGEIEERIREDQITNDEWIEWARPIWYGIRESGTLNAAEARQEQDEKHIAALQLETLRRAIRLWSNPDDLVLDPFAGIGSTGYVALQNGRRFVGIELKRSYFEAACRNIEKAESRLSLWDTVPA